MKEFWVEVDPVRGTLTKEGCCPTIVVVSPCRHSDHSLLVPVLYSIPLHPKDKGIL